MLNELALNYSNQCQEELKELLFTLCAIPAPSNNEIKRAEFCKKWLEDNGAKGVYIDEALNCVFPYECENDDELMMICAHTDTVFPDLEPFFVKVEDDLAYCPGIGDDTANLAQLMMLIKFVLKNEIKPKHGIVFACNAGEEGLGNLKGVRKLMEDYKGRVKEFISLDGSYMGICNKAVGSMRYEVTVKTIGGHSYGSFGNPNAIERLSAIISSLYSMRIPQKENAKTTYNVGLINGGTSVNTIAQEASMLFEMRSDDKDSLDNVKAQFEGIISMYRASGLEVDVKVVGERPCMGVVDADAQKALEQRTSDAIIAQYGTEPHFASGSTDCNIPFSLGIPSVCFGGYLGRGAHTRSERITLSSLPVGTKVLMDFLMSYFA